jgi:peptidoglycan/xylan/chitin deacetylase (PgdA/CDA1 family)
MGPFSGDLGGQVRRGIAPAAKRLLFKGGAYGVVRAFWPNRGLAILRYHAICGPDGHEYADPSICVTPAAFEAQVAYLASHYRIVSLPEAVRTWRSGRPLPLNAIAITFDDGYADNLPAARVLQRFGATGTFYITAGCLSGEAPFWPAELRQLVTRIAAPGIRLVSSGANLWIPCATAIERRQAIRTLSRLFKSNPILVRERLRDELRQQAGSPVLASPMLTWDEVRQMHALGMTIGAHTVTHPNLPSAGLADARREIEESRARLEREVGARVTMFSYPNGGAERYMTKEIARIVEGAGFEAATTSRNGVARPGSDLYALERVQVSERIDTLAFALEVERFAFRPAPRVLEGDR